MAFEWKQSITTDHTQLGAADCSNFTLVLARTDNNLRTVANGGKVRHASGYDIRPYSDANLTTALTFQLKVYNASTGAMVMYVQIPTLTAATDVTIYLGVGDSGISSDGSSTSVWDSSFKYVMAGGDGTTLALNDIGQSGNTVTNHGATAITGLVGGAARFASGSSQYANGSMTYPNLPITISGLFRLTSTGSYQVLVSFDDGSTNNGIRCGFQNTNVFKFTFASVADYEFASFSPSAGTWYYFCITVSGAGGTALGRMVASGAFPAADSAAVGTPTGSPTQIEFGRTIGGGGTPSDYLDGDLDEVRISNVVRSASWLQAEYANLKSGSTLLTWGTMVSAEPTSGFYQSSGIRPAPWKPGYAR